MLPRTLACDLLLLSLVGRVGRTRVRSNIQNVLVITKARDNRLIKLTRDLALYLMCKHGLDGRGIVVYVTFLIVKIFSLILVQLCRQTTPNIETV